MCHNAPSALSSIVMGGQQSYAAPRASKNLFYRICSAKRSSTMNEKIAESRRFSITPNEIF
jgi:hypothetical protein